MRVRVVVELDIEPAQPPLDPVLTDLKVTTTGSVRLSEVYPVSLPDLFHGGQLIVRMYRRTVAGTTSSSRDTSDRL
jgi:hypothetical protein